MTRDGRLEGWKRIAAYLDRDESTVKRWEAARDLPVRRLRGAGRSPVYAVAAELDQWRESRADDEADPSPPPRPLTPFRPSGGSASAWARRAPRSTRARLALLALAPAMLAGAAMTLWAGPPAAVQASSAVDAGARELYEQGQFALEKRSPASLAKAASDFSQATARDPRFAAAYSGLAETWLLLREYGQPSARAAYPRAEAAARAALALDPDDAGAHRVLGFVDYWWRGDARSARAEMARALAAAPASARTHHWLANILDATGDHAEGLREIERARRLSPNSSAIEADRAKMLLGPRPAEARAALAQLLAFEPNNRSAWAYLAQLEFAEGHDAAFLAAARREASIRGDAATLARDARYEAIYRRDGHTALVAAMRATFVEQSGHPPTESALGFATQGTVPGH